jgi:CelD/BcsL family acetyltransferase involved in cellulose biosynthesis
VWRELERHSEPNPFLTFEWMSAWWHALGDGRTPWLVVAEDERGSVVGIAPLMRTQVGAGAFGDAATLECIGQPQADRLGFVTRRGRETEVAGAVASFLRDRADWDVLRLKNVPVEAPGFTSFTSAFRDDHIVLVEPGHTCPYLPIEGTWDAYFRSRQKRFRVGLRHDQRRILEELGGRMTVCKDPEHAKRALEFLFEHNAARFAVATGTRSGFGDPRVQAFHLEIAPRMLEQGMLDCRVIEAGDAIVAVDYGFRHGGKVWGYNAAFDARYEAYGLGRVLLGWAIEQAFLEGLHEYDFLLGDYAYKRRWATHSRQHREIIVARLRPAAVVSAALPTWRARVKRGVMRALRPSTANAVRRLLGRKPR